jgi:hypothetical protein
MASRRAVGHTLELAAASILSFQADPDWLHRQTGYSQSKFFTVALPVGDSTDLRWYISFVIDSPPLLSLFNCFLYLFLPVSD